jgi:hypothetical protein
MTETTTLARPTGRLAQLLDAMAADDSSWSSSKAFTFYRSHVRSLAGMPHGQVRAVARGDLRDLTVWGHLVEHDEPGHRSYSLTTSTTGEPS